ncbi:WhiB family transcriptional regulator [Amycolatopsis aidingensis]|uniref:WhiB family transcriptional regulator n=1 Tax=Amycolatopsis aidingensis TaxID=2842453 RepID=UPI001E376886|nr:WhiB family transcriptional regulator [Amycolatopsis aidingensis]
MNRDDYEQMAARLDRYAGVPDAVLYRVVTRDGLCFWAFDRTELPELSGQEDVDRELAAWMCAGCPVMDECLELELRTAGESTVGVWGALPDTDRRAVWRVWKVRHPNRRRGGEQP